jgi:RNA 3'-terminal phosphate cyclase (ATP)
LLVPMALAHGRSTFTTDRLTSHAMTNISLLRQWLNVKITVRSESDGSGSISVSGIGWSRD